MMAQGREPLVAPAWMNPKEAADYIGVAVSMFYRTVMEHLDVRKLGSRTVVSRASLDSFMNSLPKQPRPGLRTRRGPSPGRSKTDH